MKALGLIETYGFIGSIEAADVMLKAANVNLLKSEKIGSGLVTITVEGDVGAVKTAVEAASSAIQRLEMSSLYGAHVIPRPDMQLFPLLSEKDNEEKVGSKEDTVSNSGDGVEIQELESTEPLVNLEEKIEGDGNDKTTRDSAVVPLSVKEYKRQLEKKRVAELRVMIANNTNISITEEKLSGMVRKNLIKALVEEYSMQLGNKSE